MARRRSATSRSSSARYDIVAIGASWGGVEVLSHLVGGLPQDWSLPVVIVQHQHPSSGNALARILSRLTSLPVIDIEDKDKIRPGHVYIAPANYHLLAEQDGSFSLSLEAPVNFSRPSIDVTFGSLARAFHERCIGIVLTGANDDGAEGIRMIRAEGGYAIAQSPSSAQAPSMPEAAIAAGVDAVLEPDAMVLHLLQLQYDGTL